MKIFLGYDPREALGTWVFQHSVLKKASVPVQFTMLNKNILQRDMPASTGFVYSRYFCAQMAHYAGDPVLFADGADQICLADVAELKDLWQMDKAVQVVKRPSYVPTSPKFKGTQMESANTAYPCKQWSSVMLINPSHYGWRRINIEERSPDYWHGFGWLSQNEIGELPPEWNRLIDEGDPTDGKILHWTLGVPAMHEYRNAPGASIWWQEAKDAMNICDRRWVAKLNLATLNQWKAE